MTSNGTSAHLHSPGSGDVFPEPLRSASSQLALQTPRALPHPHGSRTRGDHEPSYISLRYGVLCATPLFADCRPVRQETMHLQVELHRAGASVQPDDDGLLITLAGKDIHFVLRIQVRV